MHEDERRLRAASCVLHSCALHSCATLSGAAGGGAHPQRSLSCGSVGSASDSAGGGAGEVALSTILGREPLDSTGEGGTVTTAAAATAAAAAMAAAAAAAATAATAVTAAPRPAARTAAGTAKLAPMGDASSEEQSALLAWRAESFHSVDNRSMCLSHVSTGSRQQSPTAPLFRRWAFTSAHPPISTHSSAGTSSFPHPSALHLTNHAPRPIVRPPCGVPTPPHKLSTDDKSGSALTVAEAAPNSRAQQSVAPALTPAGSSPPACGGVVAKGQASEMEAVDEREGGEMDGGEVDGGAGNGVDIFDFDEPNTPEHILFSSAVGVPTASVDLGAG